VPYITCFDIQSIEFFVRVITIETVIVSLSSTLKMDETDYSKTLIISLPDNTLLRARRLITTVNFISYIIGLHF